VYLFVDYSRIEDDKILAIKGNSIKSVTTGEEYSILTYNIGFCAYLPDFGFFMDGGTESRAKSKQSVLDTLDGINQLIDGLNPDFMLLEEVDEKATRSYKVNQRAFFEKAFTEYNSVFTVNYDSSYLFYPFLQPHGKSLSGMLTFSRFKIDSAIRRSLPIETSLMKFFDLDRCYTIVRIPVDNGKEMVLYTVHLSAYTSDGTIATKQIEMLTADMQSEYQKGNYVVCGGDFNKDLLGNSAEIFGRSGEGQTWAQPFPLKYLEGRNLSLVSSLDENNPLPSCRNVDAPYNEKQFLITVDGFIVSDNVLVNECVVQDGQFTYSDHNPVLMKFSLKV
jgi:endonuclease/exonuclease/phosphatase family metal-dependent hydrolase